MSKKVLMMVFTVLAPEVMLLKAIGDFTSATGLTKLLQGMANSDCSQWSQVHTFFTNMGGIVIHFNINTPPGVSTKDVKTSTPVVSKQPPTNDASSISVIENPTIKATTTTTNLEVDVEKGIMPTPETLVAPQNRTATAQVQPLKQPKTTARDRLLFRIVDFTLKQLPESSGSNTIMVREILTDIHSKLFTGESTGFKSFDLDDIVLNLARLRGYDWALDGPQLILAREMGIIDRIPNISKGDIEDKSKSDFLVKFSAVAQVMWQIIQLIIRWKKGLPSSQIEVATVGFSLCAFIMYLAYWNKPQNVQTPHRVQAKRYPTKEEIFQLAERGPAMDSTYTGIQYSIPEHAIHIDLTATEENTLDGGILGWSGVTVGGVLFGLMHCTAWNFDFPTPVERLLWRIASIITTALPILHYVRALCWVALGRWEKNHKQRFISSQTLSAANAGVRFFGATGLFLYFISRIYLVVETFRSLLYLSPDTFQTTT
jgi:hypothetical protein